MGEPGDPTAKVMMTPVPAHLTTDDDQLTDAAGISVGRYGAKAVLAVPGAGVLLSASVIARLPLAMERAPARHTGSGTRAWCAAARPRRRACCVHRSPLQPGCGRAVPRCGLVLFVRSGI